MPRFIILMNKLKSKFIVLTIITKQFPFAKNMLCISKHIKLFALIFSTYNSLNNILLSEVW
jgi:hypothetical protein